MRVALIVISVLMMMACASEPLPLDPRFEAFMAIPENLPENVPQTGHGGSVPYVAYSPDGKRFATVSLRDYNEMTERDRYGMHLAATTIKIWDTETNNVLVAINAGRKYSLIPVVERGQTVGWYSPVELQWSSEGRFLICGTTVYDTYTGDEMSFSSNFAFSPDLRYMVKLDGYDLGSPTFKDLYALYFYNTIDGKYIDQDELRLKYKGHPLYYAKRTVNPLIRGDTASSPGSVYTGPAGTDLMILTLTEGKVEDGTSISSKDLPGYSGGTTYRITGYKVEKVGTVIYSLSRRKVISPIFDIDITPRNNVVAFSPDAKLFAKTIRVNAASTIEKQVESQTINLYSIESGQPTGVVCKVTVGFSHSLRFSLDGKQLFVESSNAEMYIFDTANGKIVDILDLSERNRRILEPSPQFRDSSRLYDFGRQQGEE